MKKTHILGLVVIALAAVIIVSTAGDASVYVTFDEAKSLAENGNDKKIHVVGQLVKDHSGEVIGVLPSPDKLSVRFLMIDENKKRQEVYYNEPMPSDLLRSEQVVVIGSYREELFVADKILLKCPSKYEEQEIKA
jgi:cytochrome c-type biogenesis protein CcmE